MGRKNRQQRKQSQSQKSSFLPYNIFGGDVLPYLHAVPTNYDWDGEGGRTQAFKYIGTINRCVNLIADASHSMPWQIVRGKGKKKEVIATSEDRNPSHPLAKAIQNVFKRQGQPLFALMSYSTLINGETYLEKVNDGIGFRRIKWLNPLATEPIIIAGDIQGYRYTPINGGSYARLDAEQVAYYHTFSGDDDLRGHSLVEAAMREINLDRSVYSYVKNTLWNNARPGLILAPASDANSGISGMFTPHETAALERQASDFHRGTQNAHNTLISPRPLNVTSLESPDIDRYYGILDPNTRKIAMTFGTPLAMLGDSNASTYKDGKDVRDSFYINKIIPHCRLIGDFVNIDVMPDYAEDPEDTFEFDTSEFEDTSDAAKSELEVNNGRLGAGYITMADAARAQGLDPAPELEGLVMIEGTPVPLSEVGNLWRIKWAAPAPQFGFGQSEPDTSRLEIQTPETPQLPARAEYSLNKAGSTLKVSKAGETDYCILAPLPNNASVKMIQDVLRGLIPSVNIMEWQDPKTFHLTLTYATGTQEQVDTVYIDGLLQTLIVDRVDQFDTPEGWAVHLVVRSTQDIVAYQSRLVRDMRAAGMELSTYSDVWQPHITLCYTSEPIEPFAITPIVLTLNSVDVSDDDYQVVSRGALKTHAHKPYVFEKPLPVEEWRRKAIAELIAWQKHEKAGKTRQFEPVYTAHLLDEFVSGPALEGSAMVDKSHFFDYAFAAVRYEPFKATLARIDHVFDPITRKDIGETRQEFEDEFLLAIADAKEGNLTKTQLRALLHTVIRTLGEQAYRDGLEDGGVKDAELSDEDLAEIARIRRTSEGYANDFVKEFDTYSEAQLDQRPKMWTLKTLNEFYLAGLASADANGIYVWRLGNTEEHCDTCLQMNGQRMRLKTWIKNGILPQSDKLACKGFNCDCGLFNIRGGARG